MIVDADDGALRVGEAGREEEVQTHSEPVLQESQGHRQHLLLLVRRVYSPPRNWCRREQQNHATKTWTVHEHDENRLRSQTQSRFRQNIQSTCKHYYLYLHTLTIQMLPKVI